MYLKVLIKSRVIKLNNAIIGNAFDLLKTRLLKFACNNDVK